MRSQQARYIREHKDGCLYHNHCLSCPFERCLLHYASGTQRRIANTHRFEQIANRLTTNSATLAQTLNISIRTIDRMRHREKAVA